MRNIIIDNSGNIKGFDTPFKNMSNLQIVEVDWLGLFYKPKYDMENSCLIETASQSEKDYFDLKKPIVNDINLLLTIGNFNEVLNKLDLLDNSDDYVIKMRDYINSF